MNPNKTLDPLDSIICTIAFNSRDMSTDKRDAWLYGIVCGWEESIKEIQEQHGWSDVAVKRLKILHKNYKVMVKESKRRFKYLNMEKCPKCRSKNIRYGNRDIVIIDNKPIMTFWECMDCKYKFNHDGKNGS